LTTSSNPTTRPIWPYDFGAKCVVSVGPTLGLSLEIRNTASQPFEFEEGLHTYFAVSDVRQIAVQGLAGHAYIDRNIKPEEQIDPAESVRFERRVDRVYRDATGACTIRDPGAGREIVVEKENSGTTVVWNPWTMAPGEFPDLAPEEWQRFVCVESCNARDNALTLAHGAAHTLRTTISLRPIHDQPVLETKRG